MEFADLVATESRGVVAAVSAIVGDTHRAEEIAQDAFEKCYLRWRRVSRLDKPGAWVRRVAINAAMSNNRRGASERRALQRTAGLARSTHHDEITLADETGIWAAVRALPKDQATVIALRYAADLGIDEIAATLSTTPSSVKSLLHRARRTLRESGVGRNADPTASADIGSVSITDHTGRHPIEHVDPVAGQQPQPSADPGTGPVIDAGRAGKEKEARDERNL